MDNFLRICGWVFLAQIAIMTVFTFTSIWKSLVDKMTRISNLKRIIEFQRILAARQKTAEKANEASPITQEEADKILRDMGVNPEDFEKMFAKAESQTKHGDRPSWIPPLPPKPPS